MSPEAKTAKGRGAGFHTHPPQKKLVVHLLVEDGAVLQTQRLRTVRRYLESFISVRADTFCQLRTNKSGIFFTKFWLFAGIGAIFKIFFSCIRLVRSLYNKFQLQPSPPRSSPVPKIMSYYTIDFSDCWILF